MLMLRQSTRLMLIASIHLAHGYNERKKIPAPYIAEKCNINPRALMPALRRLTQVGILNSKVGGIEPGFIFAKKPSEISMYDIINALEDNMRMTSCRELNAEIKCDIENCDDCAVYKIFNTGISKIIDDLKKITLSEHIK